LKDIITSIKATKTIRFPNQNENKGCLIPNPDNETRKTRTQHVQNKIQKDFIAKKEYNMTMTKKIPKTIVEQTKSNGEFYIYLYLFGT
jgi:hypothetical protein